MACNFADYGVLKRNANTASQEIFDTAVVTIKNLRFIIKMYGKSTMLKLVYTYPNNGGIIIAQVQQKAGKRSNSLFDQRIWRHHPHYYPEQPDRVLSQKRTVRVHERTYFLRDRDEFPVEFSVQFVCFGQQAAETLDGC